jgi:hypothetical protein
MMNENDKTALYRKAWERWGQMQLIMLIEEPAELIKTVTKYLRNKSRDTEMHIAEEVADVEIVCEQYRRLPDMDQLVNKYKEEKLQRLKKILDSAELL